jgi:hypothetical protein
VHARVWKLGSKVEGDGVILFGLAEAGQDDVLGPRARGVGTRRKRLCCQS